MMRVEIQTTEKVLEKDREPGLFNRFKAAETYTVWHVETRVDLTQEEHAIIDERKLWDTLLYIHHINPLRLNLYNREMRRIMRDVTSVPVTIKDFFERPTYLREAYDPLEAQAITNEMQTVILPRLKQIITSAGAPAKPTSFEL